MGAFVFLPMLATKLRGGTIVYFISGLTGADAVSEVTK